MNETTKIYATKDALRQQKAARLRDAMESLCVDARNGEMEPAMIVAGEKFSELMSAANAVGKNCSRM